MNVVIDASVAVGVLLGRLEVDGRLHAPALLMAEVLSALRRLVRAGAIAPEVADRAAGDLDALPVRLWDLSPLTARAWTLRDELTIYDAMSLALAEGLPEAVLLTADRGLAARAERYLGSARVRVPDSE